MRISEIIDLKTYPISDSEFRATARAEYRKAGVLVMPGFVRETAIEAIKQEGRAGRDQVYADTKTHNVYLAPSDPAYPADHARNRLVTSSKGCLTDDQIKADSPLRQLYDNADFRAFLCAVLEEEALYEYADPLSSINLHFARTGQELGWHFDNSSFSITLMVDPPQKGGAFEYLSDVRDADGGEMGFDQVDAVLDGKVKGKTLVADAGTLTFFRGRNSLHRVAPNEGAKTRILAVLAYNSAPGVALSEQARRIFYGRVG